ncbi:unnamed protein product [Orchesella dallaii]|uniref:Uncharacterized protein n=1 Tax=Orchesella dallaii TaxID=48710 RepID=A0ABP1QQW7_9HEXA
MNILRSIFAVWFPFTIEPIAELLGFRSAKAKSYCQSGSDHHKSWSILRIVFEGIVDELLYSYVVKGLSEPTIGPTVDDFMAKVKTSLNENVIFAHQFAFEICFPLLLFRSGIRQCNFIVGIQAREVAAGIFYAFRHPKYQKINALDLFELQMMPKDLRKSVYLESVRIPGSSIGQGIDFLLEQRNKQMKRYVVYSGVPTFDQWIKASNSMPVLDEICNKLESDLEISRGEQDSQGYSLKAEKLEARKYFRTSGYCNIFEKSALGKGLTVPSSIPIEMLTVASKAFENKIQFYKDFIKNGHAHVDSYVAYSVEREQPEKWDKARINFEINKLLPKIPDSDRLRFKKGLSSFTKAKLLARYQDMLVFLEDLNESAMD